MKKLVAALFLGLFALSTVSLFADPAVVVVRPETHHAEMHHSHHVVHHRHHVVHHRHHVVHHTDVVVVHPDHQ